MACDGLGSSMGQLAPPREPGTQVTDGSSAGWRGGIVGRLPGSEHLETPPRLPPQIRKVEVSAPHLAPSSRRGPSGLVPSRPRASSRKS